jgi:hypothetical protein
MSIELIDAFEQMLSTLLAISQIESSVLDFAFDPH